MSLSKSQDDGREFENKWAVDKTFSTKPSLRRPHVPASSYGGQYCLESQGSTSSIQLLLKIYLLFPAVIKISSYIMASSIKNTIGVGASYVGRVSSNLLDGKLAFTTLTGRHNMVQLRDWNAMSHQHTE
jgi:hypothetical protein